MASQSKSLVDSFGGPPNLLLDTNATSSSWSTLEPTTTKPNGAGVIDIDGPGFLHACFIGTDGNNETFDARFVRWDQLGSLWVPRFIVSIEATLSSSITGASGNTDTPNGDSDLFADELSATGGLDAYTSDAGIADTFAQWFRLDLWGGVGQRGQDVALLQVDFNVNTAASANLIYYFGN